MRIEHYCMVCTVIKIFWLLSVRFHTGKGSTRKFGIGKGITDGTGLLVTNYFVTSKPEVKPSTR